MFVTSNIINDNQKRTFFFKFQVSQFTRGGLSLCLQDNDVAQEFRNLYTRTTNVRLPKNVCKK